MKLKKVFVFMFILLTLLSFMSSKSKDSIDTEFGPKRLKLARGTDVQKLDLFNTAFISDMIIADLIYDPLVKQNADGSFVPYLATRWEVNDNATEWTFFLRKDALFSDGSKFTAADVKATYEYPLKNKLSQSSIWAPLIEVRVIDDYTCKFIFNKPFGTLLTNLYLYRVMSKELINQGPTAVTTKSLGTGPYMLSEWNVGNNVLLVRNPNFWGEKPFYDEFEHKYIAEDSTRLAAVQTGQVDISESISVEMMERLKNDPSVVIYQSVLADMHWLCVRTDIPPFNDVNVRRALSLCLDRKVFIDMLGGAGKVAKGILPSAVIGFDDTMPYLSYDPARARQLLAASSYKGEELDFMSFSGSYAKTQEQLETIQAMMKAVGFNVKLTIYDSAGYAAARSANKFHLFWTGGAHQGFDPHVFLTARIVNNTMNHHYKNNKLFELIELGGQANSIPARIKYYNQAVRLMVEEMAPFIPIYEWTLLYALSPKVDTSNIHEVLRADRRPDFRLAKAKI